MYLLNNIPKMQSLPWPHLVIDDALPSDVADGLLSEWMRDRDRWKWSLMEEPYDGQILVQPPVENEFHFDFFMENFCRRREMYDTLCRYFSIKPEKNVELDHWKYIEYPRKKSYSLIRGWHDDNDDKLFHIMYYLGNEELLNGNFEARDHKTGTEVKYPFRHNRLIIWHNAPGTTHRFGNSIGDRRRTMSICFRRDIFHNPLEKFVGVV